VAESTTACDDRQQSSERVEGGERKEREPEESFPKQALNETAYRTGDMRLGCGLAEVLGRVAAWCCGGGKHTEVRHRRSDGPLLSRPRHTPYALLGARGFSAEAPAVALALGMLSHPMDLFISILLPTRVAGGASDLQPLAASLCPLSFVLFVLFMRIGIDWRSGAASRS
jgi:hypothetical protein